MLLFIVYNVRLYGYVLLLLDFFTTILVANRFQLTIPSLRIVDGCSHQQYSL